MEPVTDFDEEAVYDEEISPLMTKIIEICKRRGIPLMAVFQYAKRDADYGYCTTNLPGPDGRRSPYMAQHADLAVAEKRRNTPFVLAITETTSPNGSVDMKVQRIT
jgi:hypothetical protein